MFASITRLAVIAALVFGAYKFYPRFKPALEPIIKPEVLGAQIIHPALKVINDFLPDSLQIPTPGQTTSDNVINTIIEDVKKKAGKIAQDQIDAAKVEAGKAFCQVLIEKVKTECGP